MEMMNVKGIHKSAACKLLASMPGGDSGMMSILRWINEIRILCFCVPLFFFITGYLPAATLHVALDGSQQYTSIQSAISASVNGDVQRYLRMVNGEWLVVWNT